MLRCSSVAFSKLFGSGKRPSTFAIWLLVTDGQRVANTTLIDTLLDKDFQLIINNEVYDVKSPEKGKKKSSCPFVRSIAADRLFIRFVVPPSQRPSPANMQRDLRT